jgi:serine/threonine protein kinase
MVCSSLPEGSKTQIIGSGYNMQPPAPEISTCPTCGGLLDKTPDGGLGCMSCLLRAGIGSEEEVAKDSTPNPLGGGTRFGVYEIDCHADGSLCELGRGAMGVTYRATDTSLQRKVALKIIKTDIAERSADARERFVREARAAAALRHEHIATVYQFGMRLETGQYFYAMELIEGETLDERVHRAGPLDARTTIGIAEQVTSALAAAEKHGLVHRDLKPANLMLVNADDPEVMGSDQARSKRSRIRALRKSGIPGIKIIDFGLAKAFHTATDPKSLTHDEFVGTPAFASPEQFEHSALDVRSDIYSLGETLWFALTGKTPFTGQTLSEIHRAQKSNALPVEQLKAAHVPHRLKSLLESMLAFEPASRPGTHELAAHLQRCSPEARSVRRTRAALAVATVVVFGVSTLFLAHRSQVENAALNTAPDKSIAVLPFENLSDQKQNAYFADGVQDEILTYLAKVADLKVISRTSVLQYKSGVARNLREIAQQLGVANVVEGSVQRSGHRVRVNAQLVGRRPTIAIWPMSSPSKARSPRQSPISCRRSFHLTRRRQLKNRPPPTWPPSISTRGPRLSFSHLVPLLSKTCNRRLSFLIKPLHETLPFSKPTTSWSMLRVGRIRCMATIHLAGLPWRKRLSKRQLGCGQMLAKRISRGRTICITACATTTAH